MIHNAKKTRNLVFLSFFILLSSAIFFIESLIPVPVPIPGFRWGFSNSIVLIIILLYGPKNAIITVLCKIFLGSMMSGRLFSPGFFMALGGGFVSVLVMSFIYSIKINGLAGISVAGAFSNNLVQLIIASAVFLRSAYVFYFLPYLAVIGTISAAINSLIALEGTKWIQKRNLI